MPNLEIRGADVEPKRCAGGDFGRPACTRLVRIDSEWAKSGEVSDDEIL